MEKSYRISAAALCGLLLCLLVIPAAAQSDFTQPGRSEIARLLGGKFFTYDVRGRTKRYEENLFKGISIQPIGSIQAGQHQFLIAKMAKTTAPEDVVGWPTSWCRLLFLERKGDRMSLFGDYGLDVCTTPKISGQRITFRYQDSGYKRIVTSSFIVGANGPPGKILMDGSDVFFSRSRK